MGCQYCDHCAYADKLRARSEAGSFMARLLSLIAGEYHCTAWELASRDQTQKVAAARKVVCYIAREMTALSYPMIGNYLNRDHSTVIYSVEHIKRLMKEKPLFAVKIRGLMGVMAIKREAA